MTSERPSTGVDGEPGTLRRRHRAGIRRAFVLLAASGLMSMTLAPAVLAEGFTVTTPYPAVVVAPGAHVSFEVSISTDNPERVNLALSGAPEAWNAAIHGGGFVVDEVETNGKDPATVRVDVDVPADATGTTAMNFRASLAGGGFVDLPLVVRVNATATGQVSLKSDFPSLKGPSTQTFSFNLTLDNGTAQDLTFSVNAQGPTGWDVQATLTGQSQAASAVIKAGSTSGVTVSATPPSGAPAGTYDLEVVATAGGQSESFTLQVEVTGTYTLAISTAGGALNGHGAAGSTSPLAITLTNTGTADITNVKLTGSGPSGWDITFDKPTVDKISPGASGAVTVNAQIKPSGDAIAGDYNVTISATGDPSATDSVDIRYTVETSVLWGIVGVALIVAVVAGVWWVFQRYGRR